jgi:ligand-binding sensor domain-containing protein
MHRHLLIIGFVILNCISFSCKKETTETWTIYKRNNGLAGDTVNAITIDANGNLWFGVYGGVSKYDGKKWTSYNKTNGLVDNVVRSIAIDGEGNKWFGTERGVSKFDDSYWTSYDVTNGLPTSLGVYAIAIDFQDIKWFSMPGVGVSKLDGLNWTTYTKSNGLVDDQVSEIAIDKEGNKWFATGGGVYKLHD